jgi:hypothetical protein
MTTRRAVAVGLIAVLTIAALLPGFAAFDGAALEIAWVLLPDETPAPYDFPIVVAAEQPDPLLSLLSSRAPPSFLLA